MGGSVGSTLSAMNSAVAGISEAGRMHEKAAVQVQRSFHGPESSTPLRAPAESNQDVAATVEFSGASQDLAGAMTNMLKADAYNRANVAALKTADEMTQELVRIVG